MLSVPSNADQLRQTRVLHPPGNADWLLAPRQKPMLHQAGAAASSAAAASAADADMPDSDSDDNADDPPITSSNDGRFGDEDQVTTASVLHLQNGDDRQRTSVL